MGPGSEWEDTKSLVINVALLASAAAFGFYLIGKFRTGFRQSEVRTTHLLDNFRELHSEGELSDEEYRNIKSQLASRLRNELQDGGQKE